MTDIMCGERLKKVFMMLKLGYKTLGKDMEMIGADLKVNPNPVIRNLNALLILGANHLHQKDNWQKNSVIGFGQAGLWVVTKDTGYRDVFFWMLDKALDHPKEFKAMLKPYVKPPEEWIPNVWEDSKTKTRKLRKNKQIPTNEFSFEETIFVPSKQEKRHQDFLKRQKKKK